MRDQSMAPLQRAATWLLLPKKAVLKTSGTLSKWRLLTAGWWSTMFPMWGDAGTNRQGIGGNKADLPQGRGPGVLQCRGVAQYDGARSRQYRVLSLRHFRLRDPGKPRRSAGSLPKTTDTGSPASQTALKAVDELLSGIVKDALQ